jgi:UDP-N-acetyl-D-glucosamine dehydrogenase
LESTTYPGTTDELLKDILENNNHNLKAGKDFYLAFSPEREDPGNAKYNTETIPKIVGGLTKDCTDVAVALYEEIMYKVFPVLDCRVAEMTKLLENIFRSVNIALVNELKMLCDAMNINIWEVIKAASTKPFGYMPFYPGPGLGGHCIPIDPFYLAWKAREYEQPTRFIELAGEINTGMHHYVIDRLVAVLNERRQCPSNAHILVIGVAYKKDVDDMRESPAIPIIKKLERLGAIVSYYDPYVPELPKMNKSSINIDDEAFLRKIDVALIITDHSNFDYQKLVNSVSSVVDTRNATKNVKENRDRISFA